MRNLIKVALLSLFISLAARADATPPAPPSTEAGGAYNLADAKWKPAPAPNEKVMNGPLAVDPETKASVGYAKFPAGFKLAPHWHSATEYSTILAGHPTFTLDGKQYPMSPGGYVVIPPKTVHSLVCGAEECVVLTRRAGATDYHWMDATAAKP